MPPGIVQLFTDYVEAEGNRPINITHLKSHLQITSEEELFDILSKFEGRPNPNNATALLHCAARKGHFHLIRCIMEHIQSKERCMNLLLSEWYGRTIVHYAAKHGNFETMECIMQNIPVDCRADVFKKPVEGKYTAFRLAADNQTRVAECIIDYISVETACQLLQCQEEFNYWEQIHYAAMTGNVKVFEHILNGTSGNVCNGEAAVPYAALRGQVEIFEHILSHLSAEQVMDVLHKDVQGKAAIHAAAKNGHVNIIECMLKHIPEYKVNQILMQSTTRGATAIHYAAKYNNSHVLEFLMNKMTAGAVNEALKKQDSYGRTAIMNAVIRNKIDVIKLLLSKTVENADALLNTHDIDGRTAAMYAAMCGHMDIVRYLMDRCSPKGQLYILKTKDLDDDTAEDLAERKGHENVVSFLQQLTEPSLTSEILQSTARKLSDAPVPQGLPPNYIEKVEEQVSSLDKDSDTKFQMRGGVPLPNYIADKKKPESHLEEEFLKIGGRWDHQQPPNYIDKAEELESTLKTETKGKGKKPPPVPPKPTNGKAKQPRYVSPNYIVKKEQLESFTEKVIERKVEFAEKEATVTKEITELERELSVTEEEKEVITEERNELKFQCNKLENELYEYKRELKRKDELIYSLGSATSVLADTNSRLQELLTEKQQVEYEREKTETELDEARFKLERCEARLHQLEDEELGNESERKKLELKREKYREIVEKLEKKTSEIEERLEQMQEEGKEKAQPPVKSQTEELLPVTTVAQQPEASGEQEVNQDSDDDEISREETELKDNEERFTRELCGICAVDEIEEDKKEILAMPVENVYNQEKEKHREINTSHNEIEKGETLKELWICKECGALNEKLDQVSKSKADDDSWFCYNN